MCFCNGAEESGPGHEQPSGDPGSRSCRVETYSGHRVHETPRRFTFQGQWLEVRRVLSRWREPENLCFIVTTPDSHCYLLKYHFDRDAWEVLIWRGSDPMPG